jgi:hypothetical protein
MLEMYHYEETLMKSTTRAIHSDIHGHQLKLQSQRKKGYSVNSLGCGLCHQHLAKACGKAVVFQCNHKYHSSCLNNAGCLSSPKQIKKPTHGSKVKPGQEWLCYTCLKSQATTDNTTDHEDHQEEHSDNADQDTILERSLEEDEPPASIVREITNQRVVKAHAYISRSKTFSYSSTKAESSTSTSTSTSTLSIFDKESFKLNLSPRPIDEN